MQILLEDELMEINAGGGINYDIGGPTTPEPKPIKAPGGGGGGGLQPVETQW